MRHFTKSIWILLILAVPERVYAQCAAGWTAINPAVTVCLQNAAPAAVTIVGYAAIASTPFQFCCATTRATGPYSMPATAAIQSISIYVGSLPGTAILGIYKADGTAGAPGTLLAQTASTAETTGWNTFTTTTHPTLTTGQSFYLAVLGPFNLDTGNGAGTGRFDLVTPDSWADSAGGSENVLPSNVGAATRTVRKSYSLYATFQ